jgi:trimethylamine--corrinoid protein Co-methyltransferase
VNFMLHACGWLEGGLVSSPEKFVLDADQLGILHKFAQGVAVDENAQAMDALREVGPGGHFLGCAHTQANYQEAFWRTRVLDYRPFETWAEDGAQSSFELAADRVKKLLGDYQAPMLDPGPTRRCATTSTAARRRCRTPSSRRPRTAPARISALITCTWRRGE